MNLIERVMGMQTKIAVFVDVDGVLNSDEFAKYCLEEEGYDPFDCDDLDPRALRNLKRIVDETGASIILSSSWRWDEVALKAVKNHLKTFGMELEDTTIMDVMKTLSRTDEIKLYLDEHPSITKYVILDDAEIKEPLADRWVRCLFKNGLTKKLADEAIEILKEK